jgi:hypothetical protein
MDEPMTPYELAEHKLREAFHALAGIPGSREVSLSLTKLEEAQHWLEADRLKKHYAAGGI